MAETNIRNIKILGAAWLGLGSLGFVYAFVALFPLTQGDTPSPTAISEGYWVYLLGALVIGIIGMVSGLALLRRYRVTHRILAISSLVLLLPSAAFWVPLLVLLPSLWLTLAPDGKEAYERYMTTENG